MEPSPDLDVLEQRYRRFLVDQYARLTFKGISRSGKAISLPLEDVYVELKAVADVPDAADAYSAEERRLLLEAEARGQRDTEELRTNLDSIRYERWRAEARAGHARFERCSIEASITGAGRPGVVILGDPGSGKSTLLRYLALCAAREGLAGGAAPPAPPVPAERLRLPILVPLAAYDDWVRRNQSALSIHDFLPLYFDKWHSLPGLGPVFRRAFDAGRALVLLDGLDEVLDVAARRHVAGQARALIQHEIGRGNRFAVTSRIVGYREAPLPGDLPHVTVLDFGPDEIETFSRKWCEACEVWLAEGRTEVALQRAAAEAKALLDEVRANPSVLRLAANPLLLTMLALLRRAGGRLPDQRIRLYERYIDTLLDNNWENVRSDGARTREPERFPLALAQSYLMELALWLQRHKPSGTARRRELEAALEGIALRHDGIEPLEATRKERQQAQERAALFLKDMRHFAGLLAERGQDAFGFLHLTFQEYFVGRALARMDDAEARWALVREHLHRPRWREPLLLCAGQLGIIEGRSRAASDYVRRILGAGSPHEEILHRDVFLAVAVAADDVGLEPRLLEEIAGRLIELTGSKVPRVRVEALRGLGQLARIGHEGAERWLEEKIRRREGPEELAEAIEAVLGAPCCRSLRRAICTWVSDMPIISEAMVRALSRAVVIDREARSLILNKLNCQQQDVCYVAIRALGSLAASDADVRDSIIAMLEARQPSVCRQAAIGALGSLVEIDGEVRDLILNKLGDQDWVVRRAAVHELGKLVANSENVRSLIIAMLQDQNVIVRQEALAALASVAAWDEKVRGLIVAMRDDHDPLVRKTAVMVLGRLAETDEDARRIFFAMCKDRYWDLRWAVMGALGGLVAIDESERELIISGLEDENDDVREAAASALDGLVATDESVRRILIAKLEDPRRGEADPAVDALGSLAVISDGVRGFLISRLDDQHWAVRRSAVGILRGLSEHDEDVRNLILGRLYDENETVREAAVSALGCVVEREEVLRYIILKLTDPSWSVRLAAARALAPAISRITDTRERILPWLDLVKGSDRGRAKEDRRQLADAYAFLLPREPFLLDAAVSLLHSPMLSVRSAGAWALMSIPGGPPSDVFPMLRSLLVDLKAEKRYLLQRLHVASLLLNDREPVVCRRAIEVTVKALDYAGRFWDELQVGGQVVRAQAARALGDLEPAYRDNIIFARLIRVLLEESAEAVLDAAYQALLRLAVAPEVEHDVEAWLSSSASSAPSEPSKQPLLTVSPADPMPPLPPSAVLHLSDLHFGTPQEADTWYSQLADDLRHELGHDRLDGAILSGDIANRSTPDEYAAARRFLGKLAAEFHISAAQLILVPGNHDLNWGLAKSAYKLHERDECAGQLVDGRFIPVGDDAVRLRDDALYTRRFEPFAAFYEAVHGKPYPLDPAEQGLLYHLPAQNLLVLGLNSAWDLDHHFKARASINPNALSRALDQIRRDPAYVGCLKIAVWHHPIHSAFEDRITDAAFLDRLANTGFRLGLHGHIHKAQSNLFRYDLSPAGRRIDLVCAGTFGAPTREWVPGYPLQYQLLRFEGNKVTVETRRREDRDGAWKPDARWTAERGKDPAPRYEIPLFAGNGGT